MLLDPNRVEEVFSTALQQEDAEQRRSYLETACAGDEALRVRVEALLRAHAEASGFLKRPAAEPPEITSPESHDTTQTISPSNPQAGDEDDDLLHLLQTSARPDSLGRLDHYEILEVLGRGGFGIVVRAFDDVLQRVVAIKLMSAQLAATSPARKRFLREARAAARVRHENVVQIYAVEEKPIPYLVMEYIPGRTLQQKLDDNGPLETPEMLRLAVQIARGLEAAHAQGLIHRDIKPGNILLEQGIESRAKITDFGLARAADDASLTQSGVVAGTPLYMAPEQARGESVDQRADLFSLGSVFYVMLSGRPPFRAASTLAVLKRVAEDTPRPIREIIPEVPEWLCRIVEKLHAKDPDERFQSAKEVTEVLADCESQWRTHRELKDFSRIPGGKPRPARGWRWAAALLLLLPLVLLGVYALTRPTPLPLEQPDDRARLQGRWRLIAAERDGQPIPVAKLQSVDWIEFDGDQQRTYWNGKEWPGTFALNTAVDPRELDFLSPEYPPVLCLYRFEGDKLVMAQALPGKARPTAFTTTPTTDFSVATYVRDTKAPSQPPPEEEGWVQLFNGKDLTGWKYHPSQKGFWRVEEGLLEAGGRDPSHLFSEQGDYTDFHLRLSARLQHAAQSGLFFRAPFALPERNLKGVPVPSGYKVQLALHPFAPPTGSLIGFTLTKEGLIQSDVWFDMEILARGKRLTVKVDGKTTADVIDEKGTYAKGHLVLQRLTSDTVIHFRKIEIKSLALTVPPNDSTDQHP